MNKITETVNRTYSLHERTISHLQSPLVLALRLYVCVSYGH